jgi:hypothetical protein
VSSALLRIAENIITPSTTGCVCRHGMAGGIFPKNVLLVKQKNPGANFFAATAESGPPQGPCAPSRPDRRGRTVIRPSLSASPSTAAIAALAPRPPLVAAPQRWAPLGSRLGLLLAEQLTLGLQSGDDLPRRSGSASSAALSSFHRSSASPNSLGRTARPAPPDGRDSPRCGGQRRPGRRGACAASGKTLVHKILHWHRVAIRQLRR